MGRRGPRTRLRQLTAAEEASLGRIQGSGAEPGDRGLLARALHAGGLQQIGTTTIRRVLQQAGSSYQRTRTWCPTGTAIRKRKAGPVQVVDPLTEQKRGPSTGPIAMAKRRA